MKIEPVQARRKSQHDRPFYSTHLKHAGRAMPRSRSDRKEDDPVAAWPAACLAHDADPRAYDAAMAEIEFSCCMNSSTAVSRELWYGFFSKGP